MKSWSMGRTRAPRFGENDDEAFAAQHLQRLAHGIGGGAVAAGEFGDDQPFVGPQPAFDDVLADELVNRRAGARSADRIESRPAVWL